MGTEGVHHAATAFSGAAAVYEQTRPGYPPEVADRMRREIGSSFGSWFRNWG